MPKFKPKPFSIILSCVILCFIVIEILYTEKKKNMEKAAARERYYTELLEYWDNYKVNYLSQVDLLRDQNRKEMEEAELVYKELLAKQPAIIEEHTRIVQETTYVRTEETVAVDNQSTSSSSATSTVKKQVISVPKPSSKPTTGAS